VQRKYQASHHARRSRGGASLIRRLWWVPHRGIVSRAYRHGYSSASMNGDPDVKRLTYAMTVLVVVLATALVPTAASAAGTGHHGHGHRKCASLRPDPGFYEAGVVATEVLTVPDSRCTTISVSHIKDPANPSDRCQTFYVGFFQTDGTLTYTEPVTACGTDGSGEASQSLLRGTMVENGVATVTCIPTLLSGCSINR
jgi:hypothetical protein